MKKVTITDMTLRKNALKTDAGLSFKEKVEVAKLLEKLRVDVIEAAPLDNIKTDTLLMKTIASFTNNSILSIPVGFTEQSVEDSWNAIKNAQKPRLCVSVPVSIVQMEFICGKKPQKVLEMIDTLVRKAKSLCNDVEFAAEDATRSERDFLVKAIETAIGAGATTVTVCDSAAAMLPEEISDFIGGLLTDIPALSDIDFACDCRDALNMANAICLNALRSGANGVKTVVDGSDYPSAASIANIIKTHGDTCGLCCNLNMAEMQRLTNQIVRIAGTHRSEKSPFDNGVDQERNDMILGEHDTETAVAEAVAKLGYDLSAEDNAKVYEAFKRVARKKQVGAKELEAIVASSALQVPPTYKVKSYVINSGNIITATAHIELEKDDMVLHGISVGDGPIDAAFLAVEQILGHHYELDDFQIQSVTEGREAMGSALVKLRSNGKLYSGNGISTDIIGASIRAYVNAVNKIVYEEE